MAATPLVASAQAVPPAPPPLTEAGGSTYTIFLRGLPIGSEQIAVNRSADGWRVVSAGRIGAPLDVVARRIQVRYTPDWRPIEFSFDGTVRAQPQTVHTVVEGTTAKSEMSVGGQTTQKSETIAADALLVLTNSFFGPYEALAARLRTAAAGSTIPMYGVPQIAFSVRVGESANEQIQTVGRVLATRRTRMVLLLPGAEIEGELWTDENNRMVRLSIPSQALDVAREDVASVAARRVTISRSNDEQFRIPGSGFTLAGTLSRPVESAAKLPAVVLVGGSGPADRDEVIAGIPILGQIANALADGGFMVVRYDKRGIGQSGGRAEVASLADYAEDVRAVVKALSDRKDVDQKQIAVVGHSEGGAVALIAASKDKRIGKVGLLAANGVTGAELVLAQQQHLLNRSSMSAEEKQAKIDLQKRIQEAVITGKGLDQLPPEVRKQVDNAEFQSILTNDPAKIMPDVRQPILIVQGELDTQVDPSNADRLEALARKRKNAPAVEVVKIPGVNHLLVPATTGEVDEYGTLKDLRVSPKVTDAIVTWLKKTP
jgi:pimeloyl-ACP methyl ester carboxylesterase